MKTLHLLLLALFICVLSSCIESREEITINSDGSGSMILSLKMPQSLVKRIGSLEAMEQEARKMDTQMAHLQLDEFRAETVEGQFQLQVTAHSDDLRALQAEIEALPADTLPEDSPQNAMLGVLSAQLQGLSLNVTREVRLADLFKGTPVIENPGFLGETSFTYLINLPTVATDHNAHRVEQDGKTLIWEYLAKDEMARPLNMSFTAPVPLPTWAIPLAVGILIVLLLMIAYSFYRWKIR